MAFSYRWRYSSRRIVDVFGGFKGLGNKLKDVVTPPSHKPMMLQGHTPSTYNQVDFIPPMSCGYADPKHPFSLKCMPNVMV